MKSPFELDEADDLVLEDLSKVVDRAVHDFLTSEVVIDPRRRAAMALCALAVRTAVLEVRCDQEGIDDAERRGYLSEALSAATESLGQAHLQDVCEGRGRCVFDESLQRVATEISSRYVDLEKRAKPQRPGVNVATTSRSKAGRRTKTPARRG